RLVGEALAQAYRVVADRSSLAGLLAGPAPAPTSGVLADPADASAAPPGQLGDIGRMLARITDAHAQRMASLGLAG
ncbi:MAG TPA: hydroxylase, partial [Streptosporangiaceae bacterium]